MTEPKAKDGAKPLPTQGSQVPAHERPFPRDYLPGGQKYHGFVNDNCRVGNPRHGMPVPEWIHQWEQIWEGSGSESNSNGKPKL